MQSILKDSVIEFPSFLDDKNRIDSAAVKRNIERIINKGRRKILIMGAAGEYTGINTIHQNSMLDIFAEYSSETTIIVSVLEASTLKAINKIKEFSQKGDFEYALPLHYYFGVSNIDEIFRHYSLAVEETNEKIYAYDFPDLTKYSIPSNYTEELKIRTGIKGIIFSDTGMKCSINVRNNLSVNKNIKSEEISSRAAFLFPNAEHDLIDEMMEMINISNHPSAALKYSAKVLGYCDNEKLFKPYKKLSDEKKSRIKHCLDSINERL